MQGVYLILNIVNGKIYIGSSNDIEGRKYDHFRALRLNKHTNQYLQNSYNKHGEAKFTFEVIEVVDNIEDLRDREQYWLDYYKSYEVGYNISAIAANSKATYDIAKPKPEGFGEKVSARNYKKIYQYSKEGLFIAEYNSGIEAQRLTGIHRNNISSSNTGRIKTAGGYYWRSYKEDIIDVNSIKVILPEYLNIDRSQPIVKEYKKRGKTVYQYSLSGEYINEYPTVKEAARINNLNKGNISWCCVGKMSSSGGYQWSFTKTDNIGEYKYQKKKVLQHDDNGTLIKEWNSIQEITENTDISYAAINYSINHNVKRRNYIWKYKED